MDLQWTRRLWKISFLIFSRGPNSSLLSFSVKFVSICFALYLWSIALISTENNLESNSFRQDPQRGEPYYEVEVEAMVDKESTTMFIDFTHVMLHSDVLQQAIADEYLR